MDGGSLVLALVVVLVLVPPPRGGDDAEMMMTRSFSLELPLQGEEGCADSAVLLIVVGFVAVFTAVSVATAESGRNGLL